jgi:hypothetical protein
MYLIYSRGPGSSVGIVTDYRLDGLGFESQWGQDFPHLSRLALGPTVSCTIGTGSLLGVESGQGVTLTLHPLLVLRSKNRVELYLFSL